MATEMTDAELQKAIDAETKNATETPAPAATPDPQEYEIKLATGQVYKGATRDEAEQKLRFAQEEATKAIRDREQQIRTLMAEKLASQQPKPSGDAQFETAKYHELLASDPLKAAYYLDSFRPEYKDAIATVETVKRANAAGTFMRRNPEYVDTPENSTLLAEKMQLDGGDWGNPDHMERAYYGLIREGKIKREAEPEPAKAAQPTPPPRLGGASPASKDIPDDHELYEMTDDQFAEFMSKRGIPVPRRGR